MMNMSVLAALAGMIFVARSAASGPQDGIGWELDAIAAVFIGGAAVSGGVGTVIGSIVGGLVMAVLNNGLQLLGVGADLVQIIKGWCCWSPSPSTSTTRARAASRSSDLLTRPVRRASTEPTPASAARRTRDRQARTPPS